jgi:hypothetical protein
VRPAAHVFDPRSAVRSCHHQAPCCEIAPNPPSHMVFTFNKPSPPIRTAQLRVLVMTDMRSTTTWPRTAPRSVREEPQGPPSAGPSDLYKLEIQLSSHHNPLYCTTDPPLFSARQRNLANKRGELSRNKQAWHHRRAASARSRRRWCSNHGPS